MPSPKNRTEDDTDVYIIPPNFIDSGSLFGGMVKLRNAIEAGLLATAFGYPILKLPLELTTRIMVLLIVVLPIIIFSLIGVWGLSLSEFVFYFFRFLFHRRMLGARSYITEIEKDPHACPSSKRLAKRLKKRIDQQMDVSKKEKGLLVHKPSLFHKGVFIKSISEVATYLPIKKIENGIIYTTDKRYIKIIEISPINFLLRNPKEQRSIVYAFISFLKISPVKVQFKSLSKKADINKHLEIVKRELKKETDPRCRTLQEDYQQLLRQIGSREAVSRRFFIVFEYEAFGRVKNEEGDAIAQLETLARTARTYLNQCGNEVVEHRDADEFTIDVLYHMLNRKSSFDQPLHQKVHETILRYATHYGKDTLNEIPATEFISPNYIDFSHMNYIKLDGVYHAYLVVPSYGYKSQVCAGWTSLLVNAGEGIDVDIFLKKEAKHRIQQKLGQHIRINRAKIKDTSDTNQDYDDLSDAISSGYYMKRGISNNEDFYYVNILITITADSVEELEWRVGEMKKLMLSQDMAVQPCTFRMEDAFLSALPLASIKKNLHKWSRRNMLTSGVASCYPFTSFEMCDDNGILLGVNKHNNSMIVVDIFNSRIYKNANMAILGTSGAGKSFTMQLMALRMRRKNIQIFIIAPLKGLEFYRACKNIGGEFIQISPSSKNCINIMEIRPEDNAASELIDGATLEKSLLASKIQRLHIFFSLLIPDMNHEERQLLDETFIRVYHNIGISHDNDSLIDPNHPTKFKKMPVLGDLQALLSERTETKRMANIMNRLVSGSASTFNQQTNVNLDNKYIVLDISELTGDLLTVGMFLVLDYVWDKAKEDRTKEKAIFIDETWRLIGGSSNKLAAEFVLEVFKIIRGYGGAAICGTQDLNDFFSLEDGKYGKGIINNSKTKIILNLEQDEADRVQDTLGLSETEKQAIIHFERGSALISTNKNNITIEFRASELETELITTDRRELQAIAERKKGLGLKGSNPIHP